MNPEPTPEPMSQPSKRFEALLEPGSPALGWTIARVPFPPAALGEMIRLRVRGEIRSAATQDPAFAFRTSLFPDSGGGFFLLVNRSMQQAARVRPGDRARFVLQADLDPRPAELPDELAALLDEDPALHTWYTALSENTRRQLGIWINAVKSDDARLHRARQTAERLLLTMEAEQSLPPAIDRALRLRPQARAGWNRMTPAQRRAELLGVFYYQTPDACERRIQKLCDTAELKARSK